MIPRAGLPQVVALRDLDEVRALMARMRVSPGGANIMDKKALFRVVRVKGLDVRAANILKQEMLSRGGEVATSPPRESISCFRMLAARTSRPLTRTTRKRAFLSMMLAPPGDTRMRAMRARTSSRSRRATTWGRPARGIIGLLPGGVDQCQHLGPRRGAGAEDAAHGGGDGLSTRGAHPAHGHAEMFGLHQDQDAFRIERLDQGVGDAARESFLELQARRRDLDKSCQFGEPRDHPVSRRDVRHVGEPEERGEVMLADRVERYVLDQHQLLMLVRRDRLHYVGKILVGAAQYFLVHLSHATGRACEAVASGVLAESQEHQPDALFDHVEVHARPRHRPPFRARVLVPAHFGSPSSPGASASTWLSSPAGAADLPPAPSGDDRSSTGVSLSPTSSAWGAAGASAASAASMSAASTSATGTSTASSTPSTSAAAGAGEPSVSSSAARSSRSRAFAMSRARDCSSRFFFSAAFKAFFSSRSLNTSAGSPPARSASNSTRSMVSRSTSSCDTMSSSARCSRRMRLAVL